MSLGKNAKVLCLINQYPEIEAICRDIEGNETRFLEKKKFLDKQRDDLRKEIHEVARAKFRVLERALKEKGVVPEVFESTEMNCLAIEPRVGVVYTKDCRVGDISDLLGEIFSS